MTTLKLEYAAYYDRLAEIEALNAVHPLPMVDQMGLLARSELRFGPFRLSPDGTLRRGSVRVPLPPKELAVLRLLVANAGHIVPASQLRQVAWGETHVSPDSLPRCVSSLRAVLDDKSCIATVYKRGYRFNLSVDHSPAIAPTQRPVRSSPETILKTATKPWFERGVRRLSVLPRLAILPFAASAGVPEEFRSSIAEETMFRLARSRTAVADVIARDSVFALAARGKTSQEVGLALHADLALTGRITALPTHFRLRAEMIRVADAVQTWVEDFLVPRSDMHHADARIATRISERISTHILVTFAVERGPLAAPPLATVSRAESQSDLAADQSDPFWIARGSVRDGTVSG